MRWLNCIGVVFASATGPCVLLILSAWLHIRREEDEATPISQFRPLIIIIINLRFKNIENTYFTLEFNLVPFSISFFLLINK